MASPIGTAVKQAMKTAKNTLKILVQVCCQSGAPPKPAMPTSTARFQTAAGGCTQRSRKTAANRVQT